MPPEHNPSSRKILYEFEIFCRMALDMIWGQLLPLASDATPLVPNPLSLFILSNWTQKTAQM